MATKSNRYVRIACNTKIHICLKRKKRKLNTKRKTRMKLENILIMLKLFYCYMFCSSFMESTGIINKFGNLQYYISSNGYRREIRLRSVNEIEIQPCHDLRVNNGRSSKPGVSFNVLFNYNLFNSDTRTPKYRDC